MVEARVTDILSPAASDCLKSCKRCYNPLYCEPIADSPQECAGRSASYRGCGPGCGW